MSPNGAREERRRPRSCVTAVAGARFGSRWRQAMVNAGLAEAIRVDQTGIEVRAGQESSSPSTVPRSQAENELHDAIGTGMWAVRDGRARSRSRRRATSIASSRAGCAPRGSPPPRRVAACGEEERRPGRAVTPEMTPYAIQISRVCRRRRGLLRDLKRAPASKGKRFVPSGHPSDAVSANIDPSTPSSAPRPAPPHPDAARERGRSPVRHPASSVSSRSRRRRAAR